MEIEHRPISGTARAGSVPQGGQIEVVERHEEPVVEKQTRAGEELVVRREADDRTEHISDTVRKTKADVGKDHGGR